MKKFCLFTKVMIFVLILFITFSFILNCKSDFKQEKSFNSISSITDNYSFEQLYFHSNSYQNETDFKLVSNIFYYNNFLTSTTVSNKVNINTIQYFYTNNIPEYLLNPGLKNNHLNIFKNEFG